MHVTSFGPLGARAHTARPEENKQLNAFEEPVVKELATKYGKSPAQIVLNHLLKLGVSVIPKTANINRLSENFSCYEFKMTEEEYGKMNALNKNARFYDFNCLDPINLPIFY